jgi:hypothetical protein
LQLVRAFVAPRPDQSAELRAFARGASRQATAQISGVPVYEPAARAIRSLELHHITSRKERS